MERDMDTGKVIIPSYNTANEPKEDKQVFNFVPGKTDQQVANELKAEVSAILEELKLVLDKCLQAGFVPQFSVGIGPFGKHIVQNVGMNKHF